MGGASFLATLLNAGALASPHTVVGTLNCWASISCASRTITLAASSSVIPLLSFAHQVDPVPISLSSW